MVSLKTTFGRGAVIISKVCGFSRSDSRDPKGIIAEGYT